MTRFIHIPGILKVILAFGTDRPDKPNNSPPSFTCSFELSVNKDGTGFTILRPSSEASLYPLGEEPVAKITAS
jgi:hypothetical protein